MRPRLALALPLLAAVVVAPLAARAEQATEITLSYKDKKFTPAEVSAPANTPIVFKVKNDSGRNLVIALAAQAPTVQTTSAVDMPVNLDAGKTAFVNSCVFCHGADGKGGHGGPAFSAGLTVDTIERTVAGGRNQMPAFGSFLNDTTIANLAAWVHELAQRAGTGQAK